MHVLVSVQQRVDGPEVRGNVPGLGQVEPVDGAALERHRQVVNHEGAVREPEVEYFGHDGIRITRTPGEVRGVPAHVSPLWHEFSQWRRGLLDGAQVVTSEVLEKGAMRNDASEACAHPAEPAELTERVRRGHDGDGIAQDVWR